MAEDKRPDLKVVSNKPGPAAWAEEHRLAALQRDARRLAIEAAPAAMRRLVALIDSEDEGMAFRASKEVLDRAVGRAEQAIKIGAEVVDPTGDEKRDKIINRLVRALERKAKAGAPVIDERGNVVVSDEDEI